MAAPVQLRPSLQIPTSRDQTIDMTAIFHMVKKAKQLASARGPGYGAYMSESITALNSAGTPLSQKKYLNRIAVLLCGKVTTYTDLAQVNWGDDPLDESEIWWVPAGEPHPEVVGLAQVMAKERALVLLAFFASMVSPSYYEKRLPAILGVSTIKFTEAETDYKKLLAIGELDHATAIRQLYIAFLLEHSEGEPFVVNIRKLLGYYQMANFKLIKAHENFIKHYISDKPTMAQVYNDYMSNMENNITPTEALPYLKTIAPQQRVADISLVATAPVFTIGIRAEVAIYPNTPWSKYEGTKAIIEMKTPEDTAAYYDDIGTKAVVYYNLYQHHRPQPTEAPDLLGDPAGTQQRPAAFPPMSTA